MTPSNRPQLLLSIGLILILITGMMYAEGETASASDTETVENAEAEVESVTLDITQLDPLYNFTIGVVGNALFPIINHSEKLKFSPAFNLVVNINPKWFKFFFWRLEGEFSLLGFKEDKTASLSYTGIGLYPSMHFTLFGNFAFCVSVGGGYRFSSIRSTALGIRESMNVPFAKGILGLELAFSEIPIAFQLEGNFGFMYDNDEPITTVAAGVGVSYQFLDPAIVALRKKRVEVIDVEIDNLFGALYTKYNELPIGKITVKNVSNRPLTQLKAEFFVNKYMDNPKEGKEYPTLGPGETMEMDLNAVFNQQVLTITEDTVLLAQLRVLYNDRGEDKDYTVAKDFVLHNRNAMTWSNTKKLGSFITKNDEATKTFSRGIVTLFKDVKAALVPRVQEAAQIFIGLGIYGIQYVSDPQTPFSRLSQNQEAVDTINYPRETLSYKSGDCDDLVILFCALLESNGIPTAFVTVPGHIFMMFNTGVDEAHYEEVSTDISKIHIKDGQVWLPVEVTAIGSDFSKAWDLAYRQLERWQGTEGVEIIPTSEAQVEYPAVALPHKDLNIILPRTELILEQVKEDYSVLEGMASVQTIETLLAELEGNPNDKKLLNDLGAKYAEAESWQEAIDTFKRVLTLDSNYFPTLLNLAIVYILREKFDEAEELLNKCKQLKPSNTNVYLALGLLYKQKQ